MTTQPKSFPDFSVENFASVVRNWIESHGDPNVTHPISRATLLHVAAEFQDEESVMRLVNAGASLCAHDSYGATPLHIAIDSELDSQCQTGQSTMLRVTKLLLALGADPTILDVNSKSPRDWANNYGASQQFDELTHQRQP